MGSNSPQYQAQYRAENPGYVEAQRKRAQARTAATMRLREKYATEFEAFLKVELRKRGLS